MSHAFRNYSDEFARDPKTAAMLSLIPGLGQYYNGQSRKGILFLDVAIVNYILLGLILLAPQICDGLKKLGELSRMEVNQTLVGLLHSVRFGTPASIIVFGMVLTFIAYAVRDAYDQANIRRRKAIYKDAIVELNEAASGSYILHASIIVGLAVAALFFFIPHPIARQVIEIEILANMAKSTPKETPNRAKNSSAAQRNFDRKHAETKMAQQAQLSKTAAPSDSHAASSASRSSSSASSSSKSSSSTSKPITTPRPSVQNLIARAITPPAAPPAMKVASITPPLAEVKASSSEQAATNAQPPVPRPNLTRAMSNFTPVPVALSTPTAERASMVAKLPTPVSLTPNNLQPVVLSSVLPATQGTAAQVNLAQVAGSSSLKSAKSGSAVMPSSSTRSTANGGGFQLPSLQTAPVGGSSVQGTGATPLARNGNGSNSPAATAPMFNSGDFGGKTSSGTGPQPVPVDSTGVGRANNPGHTGAGNAPGPVRASGKDRGSVPNLMPQVGQGVARPNTREGNEGPVAIVPSRTAEIDYSAYMAELQRRIKRAWIPPRDGSSRKVRVMFQIFTNGEVGRVQLVQGSGIALADQAATKAVENAAPFAHLPAGSPASIDVEFTFDYNVFRGSLR